MVSLSRSLGIRFRRAWVDCGCWSGRRIDGTARAQAPAHSDRGDGPRARDVHQGRGAHSAAVLPELPSAGSDRADVADDLRRRAAVRALDQDQASWRA